MKKIILFLLCGALCLPFNACGRSFTYEDYNSEAVLTNNFEKNTMQVAASSALGNKHKFSAKKMSGLTTVVTKNLTAETTATINLSLSVEGGYAKLILLDPNETVTTLLECSKETETLGKLSGEVKLTEGANRFRLVACDAQEIALSLEIVMPETESDKDAAGDKVTGSSAPVTDQKTEDGKK